MRDPGGRRRRGAADSAATQDAATTWEPGAASVRFEQLFTEYQLPIARYAQRRVAEHAVGDVVAEVFTVAWRRLGEISTPELPWLYQVAHHVIANSNRHHRREAEFVRMQGAALAGMPDEDPAMAVTSRLAAASAFGQLADGDREILGLIAWEGLDLGALARALGVSRPTATVRVHRARNRLQVALRHSSDPHPMSLEAAHD